MGEDRVWDFATAPQRIAPGVMSMVGYRSVDNPGGLHRGMPTSALTFIVSLDDGVEAAQTAEALPSAQYERVRAHGADIIRPLAETDYGANEFAVRDPEGNLWSFGDYRGEPLPS